MAGSSSTGIWTWRLEAPVGPTAGNGKPLQFRDPASGFSTFLYALPEKKLAVAIMANMELLGEKQRDDLARQVADIVAP